jgi:drug/metabolite transporter (DMT)-like permease
VSTPVPSRPDPFHHDPAAHRLALAAAALVTLLWSSSWVLIRLGLDDADLPPITFAALRYGAASVVLWGWVLRSAGQQALTGWTRRELLVVAGLGVIFYAVTQGAQFVAIDHQPAATTSLVLSITPLAVAFVSAPLLAERVSGRQVVGAAIVVAGAAVYFSGNLAATTVGMVAVLVGLTANVAASIVGRHVNRGTARPAAVVTAVSMTIGTVVLAAVGVLAEDQTALSGTAVAIIVWLAVVNTALAFTLWNHSLRHLSAVESAGVNNLMLIQIAALAWIFLGEAPGPAAIAGILLVSAGVYLTRQASSPSPNRKVRRAN